MAKPASEVPRAKLGSQGLEVSRIGLGCRSMSPNHGPPKPEPEMIDIIQHAIDNGVTFLDTSDQYGPHTNEVLIGKAIKGMREKVQIASKFGISFKDGNMDICGETEYVRSCCEASLKRLDIDCIDLYYVHRIDTRVPIEITMGELKKLVEEGKIKYIGLSEACAATIRRAHAVHPITAVQMEWSLWTRLWRKKYPLGRGFFSAGPELIESLADGDFRKHIPRFKPENFEHNKHIFEQLKKIASRKGCTTSQLALAWVLHKGDDICPIPGTTKIDNLNENIEAISVKLAADEMAELESCTAEDKVK
ncbi:hypothetical protein HAX54_038464 [Datura stramonium]|uniref:NADP-dependent oxidoreductase domain-containing protein n=1 Tax=Datura stramonium TaxID=4076 RepID=A0ABS8VLI7_DATST|nr:hypothetical protein [Datura stramonium]